MSGFTAPKNLSNVEIPFIWDASLSTLDLNHCDKHLYSATLFQTYLWLVYLKQHF